MDCDGLVLLSLHGPLPEHPAVNKSHVDHFQHVPHPHVRCVWKSDFDPQLFRNSISGPATVSILRLNDTRQ